MTAHRKLYRYLWSWGCKYQKRTFCLNLHNETLKTGNNKIIEGSRKTFALKKIITTYPNIYNEIVKRDLLNTDWESIRKDILHAENSPVTDITVDSTIIDLCLLEFHVDKAIEYIQFLKEHDYPLHVAIIGKYLRLFYLKRDSLTDTEKHEIIVTCNALMDKHPYLDSITAEHCISSLCLTDQWEKSYQIMDMIKLTTNPGVLTYSMLSSAAFQYNKPDVGWNMMHQISSRGQTPQEIAYTSYLQHCEHGDQKHFDNKLEKMFSFWAEDENKPYNRILNAFAKVAVKYGWSGEPTNFSKKGQCKICRNYLSDLTFDQETFRKLADAFMKNVIVESDIYYKSHPQELQKFIKFIAKTSPYDVVVDGLNTVHVIAGRPPKTQLLTKVIQHFVRCNQKVLVLSRKHQMRTISEYVKRNAFIFWVDNLSMDDPYLLYATLASGEKAMFVSLDLMRQHKYLLKDRHLQSVFKKWQCSHQYFVRANRKLEIQIISPFTFISHAQKNFDSWHIPYISDNSTNSETYEFPDMWYCFHKKYSETK